MIHKKLFLLLVILFFLGIIWFVAVKTAKIEEVELNDPVSDLADTTDQPNHPLVFFEQESFYAGVEQSKKENQVLTKQVLGGIVPHHLFPSFMITDFFSRLSKQNPATIILIGPNHYERGNYQVLSSLYGWQTPFGVVEPNRQIIHGLEKSKMIEIDETNLPQDHAVAAIMPFIKYYLPDTKVVPLLLSGFMSKEDVQLLSNNLKNYVNRDTIIVSAVDFSHYLTSQQAQEKDAITLELMKSYNYERLLSLNNDYLDSPPAIVTLLMIMKSLGATEIEILHHTNSGEILKSNSTETTSYFSAFYFFPQDN